MSKSHFRLHSHSNTVTVSACAVNHSPLVRNSTKNTAWPSFFASPCKHVNTNIAAWCLHQPTTQNFLHLLHGGMNGFPFSSQMLLVVFSAPLHLYIFFNRHICLTARMNSGCSFSVSVCCTLVKGGREEDGRASVGDTDLSLRLKSYY